MFFNNIEVISKINQNKNDKNSVFLEIEEKFLKGVDAILLSVDVSKEKKLNLFETSIPLTEILEKYKDKIFFLEIVNKNISLVSTIVSSISKYENIVISSVNGKIVEKIKNKIPNVKTISDLKEILWIYFLFKVGLLSFKKKIKGDFLFLPERVGSSKFIIEGIIKWGIKNESPVYYLGVETLKEAEEFAIVGGTGVVVEPNFPVSEIARLKRTFLTLKQD